MGTSLNGRGSEVTPCTLIGRSRAFIARWRRVSWRLATVKFAKHAAWGDGQGQDDFADPFFLRGPGRSLLFHWLNNKVLKRGQWGGEGGDLVWRRSRQSATIFYARNSRSHLRGEDGHAWARWGQTDVPKILQ